MSERFMTRQAVFIVVRNDQGEILLQQRTNTGYLDGYWDLPSGHVEPCESFQAAASRELLEETGLTVREEDLTLIHLDQFSVGYDYLNLTFKANTWTGMPEIGEPDKCSNIGWFAINALPKECVNIVRVNERHSFSDELTFSVTDRRSYAKLMSRR